MFSVFETAKRLGISRSKLYRLVERREIAFYRIGSKVLFTDADIQRFLESCRVEPAPAKPLPRVPVRRHLSLD